MVEAGHSPRLSRCTECETSVGADHAVAFSISDVLGPVVVADLVGKGSDVSKQKVNWLSEKIWSDVVKTMDASGKE